MPRFLARFSTILSRSPPGFFSSSPVGRSREAPDGLPLESAKELDASDPVALEQVEDEIAFRSRFDRDVPLELPRRARFAGIVGILEVEKRFAHLARLHRESAA
jgi:hypothetical protein